MQKRSARIHIAVKPGTKSALERAAELRGISLAELLRDAGLREAGLELARHFEDEDEKEGDDE